MSLRLQYITLCIYKLRSMTYNKILKLEISIYIYILLLYKIKKVATNFCNEKVRIIMSDEKI